VAKLRIKLIRSTNKSLQNQKATVRALGLKKIGSVVEHQDNPQIRGMIKTVSHLVSVEEI